MSAESSSFTTESPYSVASPWPELFPADGASRWLSFREVRKQGRPMLLLPPSNRAAARGVGLYAAQTAFARNSKNILRLAAWAGLHSMLPRVQVAFNLGDDFTQWLTETCQGRDLSELSILAGNPGAPGRRFLLLLRSRSGEAQVVKAGVTVAAKAVIVRELETLQKVQASSFSGIPRLLSARQEGRVCCFTVQFVEGESPTRMDSDRVARLLASWIHDAPAMPLQVQPHFKDLARLAETDSQARTCCALLENAAFTPVLQHGDFAPWNIKETANGEWFVLDWERGLLNGIPGWDWFHCALQTAILVRRENPGQVLTRLEELLRSPEFAHYAEVTRMQGFERACCMAFLLHLVRVLRPSEGFAQAQAVLQQFKV